MTKQRIVYPDSPFHAIAWRDCLLWAIEDKDRLAEFTADTGLAFPSPPSSPIEIMINNAVLPEVVEKFVAWFNERVWGADPYVSGIPVFPDDDPNPPTSGETAVSEKVPG